MPESDADVDCALAEATLAASAKLGLSREPNKDDSNNNNSLEGAVESRERDTRLSDNEDDAEDGATETHFKLVSPHKMFIGQQRDGGRTTVSFTGMEFNPPTESLMLTTKTVIGNSATFAVSQLQPTAAVPTAIPPAGGKLQHQHQHQPQHLHKHQHQHQHQHHPGLATIATRRYRASIEHHGDLRLASCGRDAPGELVCAGSDRTGGRHGVFRLQALSTSQPVLAQCCGPTGDRLGQFNRPAGCAVDSGCAYVADRLNHRIQRLALPTLAPLGALQHPRMFRPSHLAVFADQHYGRRALLAAHEGGVVAFDLAAAGSSWTTEFAHGRARRWGGFCVHWGAVMLADQDANSILVYRYRPELSDGAGGFGLAQRLPLAPLGVCLPRGLATHRWQDLLFVAAHDTATGEVCVLTARLARASDEAVAAEA